MSDTDRAKEMLTLAIHDFEALKAMKDSPAVAPEILGFHAQQAIEKALKAWIALLGVDYPRTHNIITLLSVIEDQHCDVEGLWDLVRYNSFAVQFRYEVLTNSSPEPEVETMVARVAELMELVQREVAESG